MGIDIGYFEGRGFSCDAANACVLPNRRFPYLGGPLMGLVYGLLWLPGSGRFVFGSIWMHKIKQDQKSKKRLRC